jgi:nucleoside-diphosphate-sugar epimerase
MKAEKFLVTGGAGFIGSNISQELINQGAKVRILDNFATGYRQNLEELKGDFEFVEGDINDPEAVKKAVDGIEVVFHEAALPAVLRSVTHPLETHHACVNGTLSMLMAARDAGVKRLIYAASSAAYGNTLVLPKVESMEPNPASPYGGAKLMAEYYCRIFSHVYAPFETISLRYFNVFGPRQDPSSQYSGVISQFINAVASDRTPIIFGDGEQTRDFTFVANIVDANIKAAQTTKGVGEVINVANGERVSLKHVLDTVKLILEKPDAQPEYQPTRQGDIKDSQADNTKAKDLLGYEKLVDFEEGLRRTIEWWKTSRFNQS